MEHTPKKIYTTGEAAKICQVAPRTISKWFDSGKLKGYRIPGSQDRRIPHDKLVAFLADNGMPIPPELKAFGDLTPDSKDKGK